MQRAYVAFGLSVFAIVSLSHEMRVLSRRSCLFAQPKIPHFKRTQNIRRCKICQGTTQNTDVSWTSNVPLFVGVSATVDDAAVCEVTLLSTV